MPITRTARNAIASFVMGEAQTGANKAFCSTGAVMFVGASTAAHSATSTFLTGPLAIATDGPIASTMQSGYPTRSCGLLTFVGLWATCAAAGVWGEWGIYNATSSASDGILLNRYPDNLGTKSTSASWQLTGSIEFTT
jgi:hypothetical protein